MKGARVSGMGGPGVVRTVGLCLAAIFVTFSAYGETKLKLREWLPRWDEGQWRWESSVLFGVHQGRENHEGDVWTHMTVEYEAPQRNREAFGLRLHPLFVHDRSHGNEITVKGVAVGIVHRTYFKRERAGFYSEGGVSLLYHSSRFEGNSSNLNFLIETGVGYKFKESGWHILAKFSHLSNAGFASDNNGVNGYGIGIGLTF